MLAPLRLSLETTSISTVLAVVFGLPRCYRALSRQVFGHRFLETVATLPTVLPPTVAGLALLLAYGRTGLIGKHLAPFGISIPFTTTAVVMAQFFVAAPFFVNTARAGLDQLHGRYETAAYTLRATRLHAFRYVVLPLTSPSAPPNLRTARGAPPVAWLGRRRPSPTSRPEAHAPTCEFRYGT